MDTDVQFGDTSKTLTGNTVAGDNEITGTGTHNNYLYGDAWRLASHASGGDDLLKLSKETQISMNSATSPLVRTDIIKGNSLFGDAQIVQSSRGGIDTLSIAHQWRINMATATATNADASGPELTITLSENNLIGDGATMITSIGGGDTLNLADQWHISMATANATGTTFAYASGTASGPELTITLSENNLIGDGGTMITSSGGHDSLNLANQWHIIMATATATTASASASALTFDNASGPELTITLSENNLIGDGGSMITSSGGGETLSLAGQWLISMSTAVGIAMNSATAAADSNAPGPELTITLSENNLIGDGGSMITSSGGHDSLNLANQWQIYMATAAVGGATATATVNGNASGPELTITLLENNLIGDGDKMTTSSGGHDTIYLANQWNIYMTTAIAIANTVDMASAGTASGPELTITLSKNDLIGDGGKMTNSTGGNDTLSLANQWHMDMATARKNGIDITGLAVDSPPELTIAIFNNNLFGDAQSMTNSSGGNDTLSIGTDWVITLDTNNVLTTDIRDNHLIGDAYTMVNSIGGIDTLSGADIAGSTTYLTGDGVFAYGTSEGGNDTLISGKGNDHMWGDFGGKDNMNPCATDNGGADIFDFSEANDKDFIYDFHRSDGDKIRLLGIAETDAMTIAGKISTSTDGLSNVIRFSDDNTITVIGVTDLTAADFLFS